MAEQGDLILRGSPTEGFSLIDAWSGTFVAGPLRTFDEIFSVARARGAAALWRESVDERGRPLGDLFKLPHLVPRATAKV